MSVSRSAALSVALRDAARCAAQVAAGRSLASGIDRTAEAAGESSRAALIDLTHGTLRRYGRMQALVRELSRRQLPDPLVQALLWCAIYALESGRYADYTVVDQAVIACALLERSKAKGFVNAVLRTFLRRRQALEARVLAHREARYQHPDWWIDALQAAYPEDWEAVLVAGNEHPPMCLRVNRRRADVAGYQAKLAAHGLPARRVSAHGLILQQPVPVGRLPGFDAGEVSVQDAGAQRAALVLDLAPGQRVLDACAAPGGKSAHILESEDVSLLALDSDRLRCERIDETLGRLGLSANVRHADCNRLADWWDGEPFDRILADVPCTASGVVRRHPDLKWLRRPSDVEQFAERQLAIVQSLWRTLRPGGKLLYATCSVFPRENDGVIKAFASRAPDARRVPLSDGGAPVCLPNGDHDGFFYALMQKQA